MCLHPVQIPRRNPVTHSSRIDVVPCGKCLECLRRKQSDYAFISVREAQASGNIVFLTLTYKPEKLPFSGVFESVSTESGQIIDRSKIFKVRPEYEDECRALYDFSYQNLCGCQIEVPTYFLETPSPLVEEKRWKSLSGTDISFPLIRESGLVYGNEYDRGGTYERALITPSLRRQDVKDWLKSSREAYKRSHGKRLEFRYFEVGEYGSHTHRPHYHILLYGISLADANFLADRWRAEYGRVDVEEVVARGSDSLAVAQEKVSRYLAKYLCKGEFEESFVTAGYVERPRRVSSRNLGTRSLDALRRYILAFDVFGEYDPDCPPPHVLTDSSMDVLLSRRYLNKVDKNGNPIQVKIPKTIIERVYSRAYGKSKEWRQNMGFSPKGKTSFVFRLSHQRTTLQRRLAAYQKRLHEDRLLQSVLCSSNGKTDGPSSMAFRQNFAALTYASETSRKTSAKVYRKKLSDFYAQDRF